MVKWEVEMQESGITDTMRINILSAMRTAIEIHGSSNMFEIAESVKKCLEETYAAKWCVLIGDPAKASWCASYYDKMYLLVKETELNWRFCVFKQTPNDK